MSAASADNMRRLSAVARAVRGHPTRLPSRRRGHRTGIRRKASGDADDQAQDAETADDLGRGRRRGVAGPAGAPCDSSNRPCTTLQIHHACSHLIFLRVVLPARSSVPWSNGRRHMPKLPPAYAAHVVFDRPR